jgi:hypothetical protein
MHLEIVGCDVYVREFNWRMYLEIIEVGDIPIFCSSCRSFNLMTCLMYVENVDLVDTSSPKLGIP